MKPWSHPAPGLFPSQHLASATTNDRLIKTYVFKRSGARPRIRSR